MWKLYRTVYDYTERTEAIRQHLLDFASYDNLVAYMKRYHNILLPNTVRDSYLEFVLSNTPLFATYLEARKV